MDNNLKTLLKQYEQKRNLAISISNNKKAEFYKKYPELQNIENSIAKLSINSIKLSLTGASKEEIDKLINNIPTIEILDINDKFIESEYKKLLLQGNHEDLIAEKGTYYKLYTGAFELE